MPIQQIWNYWNPVMSNLSSNMHLLHYACTTAHQIQLNPACCGYLWIRSSQKHTLFMPRTHYWHECTKSSPNPPRTQFLC